MDAGNRIPHTRGDEPPQSMQRQFASEVFPTHVGMNRVSPPASFSILFVFPTHVGMNRLFDLALFGGALVFPTHVGMNRERDSRVKQHGTYSPHTWG